MDINQHKLQGSDFIKSPNIGNQFKAGRPDSIVIHYTAGGSAESSIRTLTNPDIKASAHLVVARDGKITQLVAFDTIAWHAGVSRHNNRSGMNGYSIGIEIDNAGLLEKNGSTYTSWFGRKYNPSDVYNGIHRNESTLKHWHQYTEEQITTVEELCRQLVRTYNIKFILGHEEISPGRKIDPGPAFPLDKLRQRIFQPGRDDETEPEIIFPVTATVNASKLNIRKGAGRDHIQAAPALAKGKRMNVLEEKNDWYRVTTTIEGWVAKEYVKLEPQ